MVTAFIVLSPPCRHWFVLPVMVCGALLTNRALRVVLSKGSIFSADGLFDLFSFHFFFLSPLLVISLEHRLAYLPAQPDDWREWLGRMAVINIAGILAYHYVRGKALEGRPLWKTAWLVEESRFNAVIVSALTVCAAVQIYLLIQFGGLNGFADALLHDAEAWNNTGWLFVIGESTPILAIIALGQWLYQRRRSLGWPMISLVLTLFLALQILCGGLRGSRSNTVICLFWAVGIVHCRIRPVPRKVLLVGAAVVIAIMYIGGLYKAVGLDALRALDNPEEQAQISQRSGRTVELIALEDFGKSDTQAFILYMLSSRQSEYRLALGRTYLGALALLIPKALWPNRPAGKVKWTTDAEYGAGTYDASRIRSSRVYGLMGEWMLNFGWYLGPLCMAGLGLAVGVTQRFTLTCANADCRRMLIPIIAAVCVTALGSDSDNDVYNVIKFLSIPLAVLWLSSRKTNLRRRAETGPPVAVGGDRP